MGGISTAQRSTRLLGFTVPQCGRRYLLTISCILSRNRVAFAIVRKFKYTQKAGYRCCAAKGRGCTKPLSLSFTPSVFNCFCETDTALCEHFCFAHTYPVGFLQRDARERSLSAGGGKPALPAPTARPLCSSGKRVPVATARSGAVHLQHAQKQPPLAITSAETPGPEERPPS